MKHPKQINPDVIISAVHGFERAWITGSDVRASVEEALHHAMTRAYVVGWWDGGYQKPDSHAAIPEFRGKPGGRPKYPFWNMGVGQSHYERREASNRAVAAAHAYGKRHGMSFTSKIEDGGVRIWRTT